jgi:hypothetical protein
MRNSVIHHHAKERGLDAATYSKKWLEFIDRASEKKSSKCHKMFKEEMKQVWTRKKLNYFKSDFSFRRSN